MSELEPSFPSTDQVVTYDRVHGLSYIYLAGPFHARHSDRQIAIGDDLVLDFDADGHLIGIELLQPGLLHPALIARSIRPGDEWC